jgi:hypothetical protein
MAKTRISKSASTSASKSSNAVAGAPASQANANCCSGAATQPQAPAAPANTASPVAKIGKCCQPTYEQIAQRAHQIWIDKGRPVGMDIENWKQAEAELTSAA